METEVKKYQNILDIAVQHTGTAETAYEIAEANGLSLTDELPAVLTIPDEITAEVKTKNYYEARRLTPATDISVAETLLSPFGGINYMGIEIDFKVS